MQTKKSLKKIFFIIIGSISVGLGTIAAVVPMLPAFPFVLLATISFGRSSEKLDKWLKGTKLYKNNLETYLKGQGMTRQAKIRVMITVTLMMSIGFYMMFRKNLYIPCAILGAIWLFHILYFSFGVKAYDQNANNKAMQNESM